MRGLLRWLGWPQYRMVKVIDEIELTGWSPFGFGIEGRIVRSHMERQRVR